MTPHPICNLLPRWSRDHVGCLMDALRQAGIMTDESFAPDRTENPLAYFAMDSFEHFVLDTGRSEALRLLDEVGYNGPDIEEAVDLVLEQYA